MFTEIKPVVPLVSVLMPCYNHAAYVHRAIISVAEQDYQNIELVIIDDGSKDETPNIIEAAINEIQHKIKVVYRRQKNSGICKTLNTALELSSGDYVQFLASDDEYLPEKTKISMMAISSLSDDVCAIYCDGYIIDDESSRHGLFSEMHPIPMGKNIHKELLIANWIPAMGTLFRKKCLLEVGGFDPDLKYEDWDLLLRVTRKYKIVRICDVLFQYRRHATNISKNIELMSNTYQDLIKKHPDLALYVSFKSELRKSTIIALVKNINQIDLIFRNISRRLFTRRGIQGVKIYKAFYILCKMTMSYLVSAFCGKFLKLFALIMK